MSDFISWYIILLVAINIIGCYALLYFTRDIDAGGEEDGTTGHEYDGIREYNNPLPRWWLYMFYITIVFSIVYLILYPGLGNFKGLSEWSSAGQHQAEVDRHNEIYGPIFAQYAAVPIPELAADEKAVGMGQRIFATNCIACHGSDGRGSPGYPNLTDNDWLYGGSADAIVTALVNGRNGMMPAQVAIIGEDSIDDMVAYVLSLSGRTASKGDAEAGKAKFMFCAACHGQDGTGNQLLGAPNLTDNIWLYGGSEGVIAEGLRKGRSGVMPSHSAILSPEQIHLVATYVYSISER
jgi:cytochrome c oxidase cbb3-type subunit 3